MPSKTNDTNAILPPSSIKSAAQKRRSVVLVIVVMVVIALGLASQIARETVTKPTPGSEQAQVAIVDNNFSPAVLQVKVGTTVTWTNQEDVEHWIASDPYPDNDETPGLNTGQKMGRGDSYSYTFEEAGTYTYHDDMSPTTGGTIIVVEE